MSQMANAQAKRTGNSIYFAHKDLFQNKGQAQQLAVSYYNGHWGAAMKKALEQRRYYKTPHGDILFLPRAHNIHIGEDGGVYFFDVGPVSYCWNFMDELYYDINGNAYDPHGKVIVGSSAPRHVRAAYKKLLEVRLRHPEIDMLNSGNRIGTEENHFVKTSLAGLGKGLALSAMAFSHYDELALASAGNNFKALRMVQEGIGQTSALRGLGRTIGGLTIAYEFFRYDNDEITLSHAINNSSWTFIGIRGGPWGVAVSSLYYIILYYGRSSRWASKGSGKLQQMAELQSSSKAGSD